MFKSKAKKLAYEAFEARQTYRTKTQKRRDYRERDAIAKTLKREAFDVDTLLACEAFKGKVKTLRVGYARGWNDLNRKKAKSVADPLQSWVAHY